MEKSIGSTRKGKATMSINNISPQAIPLQIAEGQHEGKPQFPKSLNIPQDEPRDKSEISTPPPVEEEDESEKTNWRDVVSGALLLTGALAGSLAGTPGASMALQSHLANPPAIERVIEEPRTTPAKSSQEGAPVHIISHIDASEHIIEPFATSEMQQLEKIKSSQLEKVEIDAVLVRDTGNPYVKIGTGGAEGLIILAPSIAGWAIARKKHGATALLMLGIGGALSYTLAKGGLGVDALKHVASGVADLGQGEPVWNGTREYHIKPGTSDAIDSQLITGSDTLKPSKERAIDFIASQMKQYPGSTTVVHTVGHGLGYHASSGFDFKEYRNILNEATKQAGRPIDVLVVESCLEGNLETVIGTMPTARYVIVSEESIPATIIPNLMEKALNGQDSPTDARKFAEAMIQNAKGQQGISTLAIVDMEKVPALTQSVDDLGKLLTAEVRDGKTSGIAEAIKNTPMYPAGRVEGDMGQKLGMGDLKQFAENLKREYGDTSAGKGNVSQEAAASPRAQAIREASSRVLAALQDAVPDVATSASYQGAGGISIQLPGATFKSVEEKIGQAKFTKFSESQAPQGWKDFVTGMSEKLGSQG